MAKNHISDHDTTAVNNTDIINAQVGVDSPMSALNNAHGNQSKILADFYDDIGGSRTATGTADAIIVAGATQTLAAGEPLVFVASADNTGATTLNWNSLGVKAVKKMVSGSATALGAGAIKNASYTMVIYDGTQFILVWNGTPGDFLADGTVAMTGDLNVGGLNIDSVNSVYLTEQAAANADVAGDGQLWTKTATPNELWFTDDAGTDVQLSPLGGFGVLLSTTNITSSTATADITIPAGWDLITFVISSAEPVTDDVDFWIRTSTDGGGSFAAVSTDYEYMTTGVGDDGAAFTNNGTAGQIRVHGTSGQGNSNNERAQGIVRLWGPDKTDGQRTFDWDWSYRLLSSGLWKTLRGRGIRISNADVDAVRFMYSSGNIDKLKMSVYGSMLT